MRGSNLVSRGRQSRGENIFHTSADVLLLILVAFLILAVATALTEGETHISPDYPKIDISSVVVQDELSDADYEVLLYQTGLGRSAIDELRERYHDSTKRILHFQENFFRKIRIICERNSIISREESVVDEEGYLINGTQMAPLHNGDIIITKASHTYGWRQGHSAIVIDEIHGKTLEAVVVGTDSTVQDIGKWTNYPNFIVLRLKNAPRDLTESIAQTAIDRLAGIPYRITAGIFNPKLTDQKEIAGTQCSQLIWQAYSYYDIDLDSDGGLIVTPKDIANSNELEVLQAYGVDPGNIWP